MIFERELKLLRDELRQPNHDDSRYCSRELSLVFDGSTRLGEAIAIVARFVDEGWNLKQRLIRLDVVAHAVTGVQLAQVLHECLTDFTIRGNRLLACTRDGASVNGAAMAQLKFAFPRMFQVVCVSHTLDLVGDHFDTPTLDDFSQWWVSLFAHSYKAKLRWREQSGSTIKTYSETRWWSRWELLQQACICFGDIRPFLENNNDICPKTMDKLRAIFDNEVRLRDLRLELAAVVDIGVHFVKATYLLEGDGPLIFNTYQRLQEVLNACMAVHQPNVHAVATSIADGGEGNVENLKRWARARVQPGISWFMHKFNVELEPMLQAFKFAKFFRPFQVQSLHVDAMAVEELRRFPFIDHPTVAALQGELPTYLAACDGCRDVNDAERVAWWRDREQLLPHWASVAKKIMLIPLSSAAAERVFSMLKAAFSEQQDAALADYLHASLMLRYNRRKE